MITPSRPGLLFALCFALLAQLPLLAQQPPALPGVPTSWKPAPATAGYWQRINDRMRLTVPPNANIYSFGLISDDKIDPKSFTVDFWVVLYSDSATCNYSFDIGPAPHYEPTGGKVVLLGGGTTEDGGYLSVQIDPGRVSTDGLDLNDYYGNHVASDGQMQWVRITYNQEQERMMVYVNGQSCDWNKQVRFYGETPLALLVFPLKNCDTPQVVDVLGIRVTDKYQPEPPSLPGIAFKGWSDLPADPDPGRFPGGLEEEVRSLPGMPGLTMAGRGFALAADVMVDRVANGEISAETRDRALAYLEEETDRDRSGQSLVLPILIASSSEGQRELLQPYITKFFAPLWGHLGQLDRLIPRETVIERMATIDIARAAETLFSTRLGSEVPDELVEDAISLDPGIALGLEYIRINKEGRAMQYTAWALPKLHAMSPEFYQMARIYIGERGMRGPMFHRDEPDRSLSFAAYQMMGIDPGLAVAYWDMMKDPEDRADALDVITEGMPSGILPEASAAKIEAGLKAAVARWEPEEWDSPVPRLYRLARFYIGRNRQDDAVATIKEAIAKVGKEPNIRFRDVWLIALLAREMQLEEAPAWLDAAVKLAAAGDVQGMARYSFLNSTNVLYPATSVDVLIDLAKQGKGANVLTLVKALGNDGLGRNGGAKLATVVDALSEKDLRNAAEVWKLMPDDDRNPLKYEVMKKLAPKILERDRPLAAELLRTLPPGKQLAAVLTAAAPELAKTDLPGLVKRVETAPENTRVDMVLGIAEGMPIEGIPPLMAVLNNWVTTRLAYYAKRPAQEKHLLVAQLSGLHLSTITALHPLCTKNPDFYAELVLTGVMHAAGQHDNLLWQRLTNAEITYGGVAIYGGASKLKDNVRDFDPAERFKPVTP